MGGVPYDCLLNPLGAVRLTFDRAVSSAAPEFDPSVFDRRDWGAVDLFRSFLFERDGLAQVPLLDPVNLHLIKPNTLVRFRGMVQDMFGNEFYIGAFKDGHTWRTNKFADSSAFQMPETSQTRLWERRLLYCVPIPGQNQWTREHPNHLINMQNAHVSHHHGEKRRRDDGSEDVNNHESAELASSSKKQREDEVFCQLSQPAHEHMALDNDSKSNLAGSLGSTSCCLVKVYDAPESDIKLNDIIEFVGVYTFDPELAVHMDESNDLQPDLMDDALTHLPPSKVPRLHCIIHHKLNFADFIIGPSITEPVANIARGIRESFLRRLTATLGNDGLAASCLLLHLLSRVHARVELLAIGALSLNLTGFTRESAGIFGRQLILLLKNVLPLTINFPLTVEYLNTAELRPRKDNQNQRMVKAVLQLAPGTHLTLDESCLKVGTLNSTGVENTRVLKNLVEWQMVEYDFEYYKLEMPADIQLLVLSEGKSFLPCDLVVPFQPAAIPPSEEATPEEVSAWRWYFAALRPLPHTIEPEMQKMLENDIVAAGKENGTLRTEDFSRWLTMAKLTATSFGETRLAPEHWQMARELERLRKERVK